MPVVKYEPVKAKRENILLSVTTTDVNGVDPGADNYQGASPGWRMSRILERRSDFDPNELVERSTKHMEEQIDILGGEAVLQSPDFKPEDLPEAHIRGDVNTPYRCIGGVILRDAERRFRSYRFRFVTDGNH